MSKVFVSGSSGAIGQHLVRKLQSLNYEIIGQKRGLRVEEDEYFEKISAPSSINVFYHLAAKSFVPDSWENPADFIEANVLGTQKVIDFCIANKIRLVFVSSYAYGKPDYLPIDEEHHVKWANPYGMSKMMAEELCKFYSNNSGLDCTIVRPFNVYGTLANEKLLIPEIIDQIRNQKEIKVRDLAPKRDYVYIDDLIDFLSLLLDSSPNLIYNVGSGVSLSVGEIISICQEVFETNLDVISDEVIRQNEISETRSSVQLANNDFDWTPKVDFKKGIQLIKKKLNA